MINDQDNNIELRWTKCITGVPQTDGDRLFNVMNFDISTFSHERQNAMSTYKRLTVATSCGLQKNWVNKVPGRDLFEHIYSFRSWHFNVTVCYCVNCEVIKYCLGFAQFCQLHTNIINVGHSLIGLFDVSRVNTTHVVRTNCMAAHKCTSPNATSDPLIALLERMLRLISFSLKPNCCF